MKKSKIILVLCFALLLIIASTGCRPAERPAPNPTPNDLDQRQEYDERNFTGTNEGQGMQDLNVRADNIVDAVVKLDEVRSATVVITDNTALVGVTLDSDVEGEMNTEVKKKVEDVVRRTDRSIDRVSVSANPDIVERIENIARETGRGRPLSGFGREIEELIRRMTPGA